MHKLKTKKKRFQRKNCKLEAATFDIDINDPCLGYWSVIRLFITQLFFISFLFLREMKSIDWMCWCWYWENAKHADCRWFHQFSQWIFMNFDQRFWIKINYFTNSTNGFVMNVSGANNKNSNSFPIRFRMNTTFHPINRLEEKNELSMNGITTLYLKRCMKVDDF